MGGGLPPPQIIVMESHIKEMHFQNVYHWAYTLYWKIFYSVKSLTYCTSLHVDFIICYGVSRPIHIDELIGIISWK